MQTGIANNFFGIRIPVKTHEQVILGTIPIILLFLLWILTTTGKKTTIVLPEGTFEGYETASPKIGTAFSDKIRFTVNDAKVEEVDKNGSFDQWLVKGQLRVNITNLAHRKSKDVRIVLPPGKIVARGLPNAEESSATTTASNTASMAVNTSAPDQVKTNSSDFSGTITYRYEVVESRIFAPVILPSPWEVFGSLPSLWTDRSLLINILYSFLRVGAGFLVAFIIVFPISLLMGTFSKFHALFAPMMLFGGYLPIPALVPLTMCLFGTTEEQKVMFLALGFAIYLLPLFTKALEDVDNVYLQTGYTLGASKFQVLNKILLPMAMPKIFDAMRLGFGIGWGYIILAEMVDMGSKGVGTLILTSQRRGPREDIYLVLMAIVIMAFITDKIWEKVGDNLFPYRSQKR